MVLCILEDILYALLVLLKKEEKKQLLKDIQSHHASIAIIRVDLYQNAGFEAQRREEKIYQQQGLQ